MRGGRKMVECGAKAGRGDSGTTSTGGAFTGTRPCYRGNRRDRIQLMGISAGLGSHQNIQPIQLFFKVQTEWRKS